MMLMAIGIALILIGLIALLWPEGHTGTDQKDQPEESGKRAKVQGGAIIMIGPIPIVVGTDYRIALIMMLIALALMIIWIFVFKI